jgi:hypothetical protein
MNNSHDPADDISIPVGKGKSCITGRKGFIPFGTEIFPFFAVNGRDPVGMVPVNFRREGNEFSQIFPISDRFYFYRQDSSPANIYSQKLIFIQKELFCYGLTVTFAGESSDGGNTSNSGPN